LKLYFDNWHVMRSRHQVVGPPIRQHELLLILVMKPERQDAADMMDIAREVVRQAPEIVVHIAAPGSTVDDVEGWKWRLPTLTVSLGGLGRFLPRRGPILQNRAIKKLDQYRRFVASGIPSPRAERFEFGHRYLETDFGKFVVLKPLPLNLTSSASNLMLFRTKELHEISPTAFAPDHFIRQAPVLVQRFIDTGHKPDYFRVLTLLGEPILWMRVKSATEQVNLSVAEADAIGKAVVDPRSTYETAGGDFTELLEFEVPFDVAEFARHAYAAFPDIPLQACDIVRDAATGQLFILEINAGGNTWDFSSRRVAEGRDKLGGRAKFIALFDPWPKAAKALIGKTRELAS
jgi:hypothetical protein